MESLKQTLLARQLPKPAIKTKIHSQAHLLAGEISQYCGEPKKFGLYLGVIKWIGTERAAFVFGQLKDSVNVKTPGRLFMYLSKKK